MRPTVRGQDMNGATLWEGYLLQEHEWISTGFKHLMVTHYDLTRMIAFFLEYYPHTYTVEYTAEDRKYQYVTVPSAMPYKLASVVSEQLVNGKP